MIYEDDGAENLVLDGEFDIAIPFTVTLRGEEPEIRIFPSQKKLAEEFLRLFGDGDRLFSNEAIEWANKAFTPFLIENGFSPCEENDDYFLNYRVTKPDRSLIMESTRRISDIDGLENLTGYDFESLSRYGHICFSTVEDGRIVSAACTNYSCALADVDADSREIEIGVETAEGYRGKGFGTSNAAALASVLTDTGYNVLYECESRNSRSIALIERLGGERFARNFCVVGRKDED